MLEISIAEIAQPVTDVQIQTVSQFHVTPVNTQLMATVIVLPVQQERTVLQWLLQLLPVHQEVMLQEQAGSHARDVLLVSNVVMQQLPQWLVLQDSTHMNFQLHAQIALLGMLVLILIHHQHLVLMVGMPLALEILLAQFVQQVNTVQELMLLLQTVLMVNTQWQDGLNVLVALLVTHAQARVLYPH